MSYIRRIFVGSTTFLVTGMTSDACLQIVSAAISGFVGVRVVEAAGRADISLPGWSREWLVCQGAAVVVVPGW